MAGTLLTSELEAVNSMLRKVQLAPVSVLPSTEGAQPSAHAITAERLLNETRIEVCEEGWHFNTDREKELDPDATTRRITVPSGATRIDGSPGRNSTLDLTQRYDTSTDERLLYDLNENTFEFTSSVLCDIVSVFEFRHLPQAFRRYIMILAGRRLADDIHGENPEHGFSQQDVAKARIDALAADGTNKDANILRSNVGQRVLRLGGGPARRVRA